jgi:hypothetical protein
MRTRIKGFALVELISALGIAALICQVIFAAYLVLFRLWDAQVQDNLALVQAGEVAGEIEALWQMQSNATVALHQIKFADVTYEIDADKLIKIKNQIPETLLIHLDPAQSSFAAVGDALVGQLQMNLAHESIAYPVYAKVLK